jgi:small subunit ribosomal protein S20
LANIQSQIKRNRQNERRRLRNRDFRGSARTAVKDALASMASGQDSKPAVDAALRALDKAARKGAIHHRNAGRRKSRLMKRLAALGQTPMATPAQRAAEAAAAPEASSAKAKRSVAEPKAKTEAKKPAAKAAAKKAPAKKTAKK